MKKDILKKALLKDLSEKERAVVVLHYFDDAPPEMIGFALGIPAAEVSQILADALERLKRFV